MASVPSARQVEVAVVGLGAIGSATLWRLALRGVRCAGFERFAPGHDRGSSHGDTRIFRTAYFEGAAYVPLLLAAEPLWRQLEEASGESLLTLNGALMIGSPESSVVAGARRSAVELGLAHELLDSDQLRRRHPQHRLNGGEVALLDPRAGFLRPERAVRAAAGAAAAVGAAVLSGARAEWEPSGDGFRIRAGGDEWRARRLVLAGGPWNAGFAPGLGLTVERVVQAWWPVAEPASYAPERFPVFVRDLGSEGTRYGLSSTDGTTIKVAAHGGGRPADPDSLDRAAAPEDWSRTAAFVAEGLEGVVPTPRRAAVCMYTNAPDGHFVIGDLPDLPGAVLASACSGHGFKFAPALGEALADLATGRSSRFDLGPFSPLRLAPQRTFGG